MLGNFTVTTKETTVNVKIGELLVDAQIVSSAEMTEAVQVSKRLNVPIGRVLTMSGCVREDVLEASLQVQRLLRDGNLSIEGAYETLKRVHEHRIELAEALTSEAQNMLMLDSAESLGELLLDSNIISEEDLVKAMQASFDNGVPLGSTLVLQGLLSPSLFPSILSVQKNIARGITPREDGVKEVQEIFLHWLKAEESLKQGTIFKQFASDEITREDVASAAEANARASARAPEEVKKAESQSREPERVRSDAEVQKPAPEQKRDQDMRLVDLLKQSGIFSQAEVQRSYEALLRDPERSARFFLELGLISEEDLRNSLRAHALLQKGMLNKDEAIYAVRNERVTEYEKTISDVKDEKVKRYMDRQWRGRMSTVLGGALVGAVVAGFSMAKNKRGK